MRDHTGCIRAYCRSSKAYYSAYVTKEELTVNFGMYDIVDGSTSGEMKMEWVDIGSKITPQLQVFDDGWSALGLFTDLVVELSLVDSKDISDDEFCSILDRLGFKDITPYENPNPITDKDVTITIKESIAKKLGLIKKI